jgi:hypothetical protein
VAGRTRSLKMVNDFIRKLYLRRKCPKMSTGQGSEHKGYEHGGKEDNPVQDRTSVLQSVT